MLRAAKEVSVSETIAEPTSPPPEKGVADILAEALQLYRRHARAMLLTCAVLFVPASVVKSCALSAILGPTVAAARVAEASAEQHLKVEATSHALQEGYAHHADPGTIARLEQANRAAVDELGRLASDKAGGWHDFALYMLGTLGTIVTVFFLYGIIMPITNGALTIAVADRILGGEAAWPEVWMLLFRRLGMLVTALVPAAIFTALGFVMFMIPGLVLALFFTFLSPVVLFEGLGGRDALRRSTDLVRADWLRVALVVATFAVLRSLATMIAHLVVPRSAIFIDSLLADLLTLVGMPVPVLAAALLYFDIRRKQERFTNDTLRNELAALKA
jgi:hypothetical protein